MRASWIFRPAAFPERRRARSLGQEDATRRFEPGVRLADGQIERGGRGINPRVCRYGQKFMETRPGDGPKSPAFGEKAQAFEGRSMPRRILAMGVDEDVAVDGDHPPRPS